MHASLAIPSNETRALEKLEPVIPNPMPVNEYLAIEDNVETDSYLTDSEIVDLVIGKGAGPTRDHRSPTTATWRRPANLCRHLKGAEAPRLRPDASSPRRAQGSDGLVYTELVATGLTGRARSAGERYS